MSALLALAAPAAADDEAAAADASAISPGGASPSPSPSPNWPLVPFSALADVRTYGTDAIEPDHDTKLVVAESGHQLAGTFRMCIIEDGSVVAAHAIRSTGDPVYDESILREIETWRFHPDGIDLVGGRVCSDVPISYPSERTADALPDDISASAPARPALTLDEPPLRALGFLLRAGLDLGGDELAREVSGKSKITAGGLFSFAAGMFYHPPARLTFEATVGYKGDYRSNSDGNVEFRRFPLDLILSFRLAGHRLGAGPTIHFAPSLRCDAICNRVVDDSMETAVGVIAQYAYSIRRGNRGYDFGIRYTHISYDLEGEFFFDDSIDGSSYGLFFGGWL